MWAYIVPVELEGVEAFGYGLFMSGLGLLSIALPVLFVLKPLMDFVRSRRTRPD
jgi:hypothetical protein